MRLSTVSNKDVWYPEGRFTSHYQNLEGRFTSKDQKWSKQYASIKKASYEKESNCSTDPRS